MAAEVRAPMHNDYSSSSSRRTMYHTFAERIQEGGVQDRRQFYESLGAAGEQGDRRQVYDSMSTEGDEGQHSRRQVYDSQSTTIASPAEAPVARAVSPRRQLYDSLSMAQEVIAGGPQAPPFLNRTDTYRQMVNHQMTPVPTLGLNPYVATTDIYQQTQHTSWADLDRPTSRDAAQPPAASPPPPPAWMSLMGYPPPQLPPPSPVRQTGVPAWMSMLSQPLPEFSIPAATAPTPTWMAPAEDAAAATPPPQPPAWMAAVLSSGLDPEEDGDNEQQEGPQSPSPQDDSPEVGGEVFKKKKKKRRSQRLPREDAGSMPPPPPPIPSPTAGAGFDGKMDKQAVMAAVDARWREATSSALERRQNAVILQATGGGYLTVSSTEDPLSLEQERWAINFADQRVGQSVLVPPGKAPVAPLHSPAPVAPLPEAPKETLAVPPPPPRAEEPAPAPPTSSTGTTRVAAKFYGECYVQGISHPTADAAALQSKVEYQEWWIQQRADEETKRRKRGEHLLFQVAQEEPPTVVEPQFLELPPVVERERPSAPRPPSPPTPPSPPRVVWSAHSPRSRFRMPKPIPLRPGLVLEDTPPPSPIPVPLPPPPLSVEKTHVEVSPPLLWEEYCVPQVEAVEEIVVVEEVFVDDHEAKTMEPAPEDEPLVEEEPRPSPLVPKAPELAPWTPPSMATMASESVTSPNESAADQVRDDEWRLETSLLATTSISPDAISASDAPADEWGQDEGSCQSASISVTSRDATVRRSHCLDDFEERQWRKASQRPSSPAMSCLSKLLAATTCSSLPPASATSDMLSVKSGLSSLDDSTTRSMNQVRLEASILEEDDEAVDPAAPQEVPSRVLVQTSTVEADPEKECNDSADHDDHSCLFSLSDDSATSSSSEEGSSSSSSEDDEEGCYPSMLTSEMLLSNSVVQKRSDAKTALLHALAICGGDVQSDTFLHALNRLRAFHDPETFNTKSSSNPYSMEGTWLTLSKPNYHKCLGRNAQDEYMYSLGRMSFNMFRPTDLVCSIQGTFNAVDLIHPQDRAEVEIVPKKLQQEMAEGDSVLRSYNIVTAFSIEPHAPQFGETSSNKSVLRPIKGIMTTYGYVLPDPETPNRLSVWFTGGTMEVNDEAVDGAAWRDIFANAPRPNLGEQAGALAAKMLLGAVLPEGVSEEDLSLSYSLTKPIGGHGKTYVDVLYMDETLRIMQGHRGTVFVFTRVNEQ